MHNVLTIDVEDWFHVLDSSVAPRVEEWGALESRVEQSVEQLLDMLGETRVRATFFWLGWVAERHRALVRACLDGGHEIASHGFGHVLPYEVGRERFREDVLRAKSVLEDITGQAVRGFRAAGFGITGDTQWAFEVIREAGHEYDSSVFPARRGHGGMPDALLGPHFISTRYGNLAEIPISAVKPLGRRFCLFGGGYLRLAPLSIIRWGIDQLEAAGRPLIVYVHPRDIDVDQPRLPLSLKRRFKCYVGLKNTMSKLRWLCENHPFCTMGELAERVLASDSGAGSAGGDEPKE